MSTFRGSGSCVAGNRGGGSWFASWEAGCKYLRGSGGDETNIAVINYVTLHSEPIAIGLSPFKKDSAAIVAIPVATVVISCPFRRCPSRCSSDPSSSFSQALSSSSSSSHRRCLRHRFRRRLYFLAPFAVTVVVVEIVFLSSSSPWPSFSRPLSLLRSIFCSMQWRIWNPIK